MNLTFPRRLDPIQIAAKTVDADRARVELKLSTIHAFLNQKLARGSALPIRLIDRVDLRKTFLG
jgi:hypothetical protein